MDDTLVRDALRAHVSTAEPPLRLTSAALVRAGRRGQAVHEPDVAARRVEHAPGARLLVQHLWSTQRGSSSPGRNRGGDTYPADSTYTMPNRVLELLQADLTGPLVG